MLSVRRDFLIAALLWALYWLAGSLGANAQQNQGWQKVTVADGWHPWYELKADPEDPDRLIICGAKWDATRNALYGFVYASQNSGKTWRTVLEDRASSWVSEQSCAFGPDHSAYFLSEASKVVLGELHHDRGTARLFVSSDGGLHWTERLETGWADWSSSAVNPITGKLVTFFNFMGLQDKSNDYFTSVGVLLFSKDGKSVSGPFIDPVIGERHYRGVYPYSAVALKNGTLGAAFFGRRLNGNSLEWEYDIGFLAVDLSEKPSWTTTILAHPNADPGSHCIPANISLTYDRKRNRLFMVYLDSVKGVCELMLTGSDDGGKTWAKNTAVLIPGRLEQSMNKPSLCIGAGGILGLLWERADVYGGWLFSHIRDSKLVDPPLELSRGQRSPLITQDSLMSIIIQPGGKLPERSEPISPDVALQVRSAGKSIWRSAGLVNGAGKWHAVFLQGNEEGESLQATTLAAAPNSATESDSSRIPNPLGNDVTKQVAILYAGSQSYDRTSGTLSLEIRLFNRGDKAIRTPIKLKAESVRCPGGDVIVLNASNGLSGPGSVWDVSRTVSGDRILPGMAATGTFPLCFRVNPGKDTDPAAGILDLRARVFAKIESEPENR